jgi:hypothetical protein
MSKIKVFLVSIMVLLFVSGVAGLVLAANPDDYELVQYLYKFDADEELEGWIPKAKAMEAVINRDPKYIKDGEGSLAFRVEYPGRGHDYADMRIYYRNDEFADWSAGRYLGFWYYVEDTSVLDAVWKVTKENGEEVEYENMWSCRVLIQDAGGVQAEVRLEPIQPGWNFCIVDLEAETTVLEEGQELGNFGAELIDAGKQLPPFYAVGFSDMGLMNEYIGMFVLRQNLVEGQYKYWAYIDEIALYK